MSFPYRDRAEAGRRLAGELMDLSGRDDLLILALPRGGVPVAYEVAEALGAPMDLMIVRKLGMPGQEELAMGAIASGPSGGVRVLNEEMVERLGIPDEWIDEAAEREGLELRRRERAYRGDRPAADVRGRCVVLIDDGLATGATMLAAVKALREQGPRSVIVAVPVAPPETVREFSPHVDRFVCPETPAVFGGVGRWYEDFSQTSDAEVRELLARAESRAMREI